MKGLAGRRVLITGGSSGIGLTLARRLLDAEARVAILAREGNGLTGAQAQLPGAETIAADVRDGEALHVAVARAAARLGGLDAVVAAAGSGMFGPFQDAAIDDYEQTIATTLLGAAHTVHAALPYLEASRGDMIVIGSVAGRVPQAYLAAYSASKHGVRGLIRSLASELVASGSPVRLALIEPGPVDTPFWRHARSLDGRMPPPVPGAYRPEEVAAEVIRALRGKGPLERTVGGLFVPIMAIDAIVPNPMLHLFNLIARVSYAGRDHRPEQPEDGVGEPAKRAERRGGLHGRPSLLRVARSLL